MNFLILRSRRISALEQAVFLREQPGLGLGYTDVICPSGMVMRRQGRAREQKEVEIPLLGPFLFVRWNGLTMQALRIEHSNPFLSIMRRTQGGYATCREKELVDIGDIKSLPPIDPRIEVGNHVVITASFLNGIKAEVIRIKADGQVLLKLLSQQRLKVSALQLHGSLLMLQVEAK